MKFSEIIGHKNVINSLKGIAESGKIPHAVLFSGNSGIGKLRLARTFAQYIHCRNKIDGEPCGKCSACIQNKIFINPDTHYIFPIIKRDGAQISQDLYENWKEMLSNHSYMPVEIWNDIIKAGNTQPAIYVTESENIIAKASLSSYQENYKIFIIWQPEKMRPEAANKLLKIIEEPFEDTIFLLVSNEPEKILPTIYSRVQRFNLFPLQEEEIKDALINIYNLNDKEANEIARLSDGSMAKAEEIAFRPNEISEFSNLFKEMMRACYGLQGKKIKEYSEKAASFGREKLVRFLNYSARMVRENFIYNLSQPSLNRMTQDEENFSIKFSPFIHAGNVEELSQELDKAIMDIQRNANAKILMFDLFFIISRQLRTKN